MKSVVRNALLPGPRGERPATSASNIGCSSRGGPGSSTTSLPPTSTIGPGAVPLGLSRTVPPSSHHRLPPVDVRHPKSAARKSLPKPLDDLGILRSRGRPTTSATSVAGHIVVGGTEAAGQDDEVDALERAPEMPRDLAPVVADHGLRPQLDAERREALGEEQRVGVEAGRAQQLAADRDDLGGAAAGAGAVVMRPIPATASISSRSETFA